MVNKSSRRSTRADGSPRPAGTRVGDISIQDMVDILEEDIVLGRLYPRQRLVENELMLRFQVSRHAVRQVLSGLERLYLVEQFPNRGAAVRAYSVEEIDELYAIRTLIETDAAKRMPLPFDKDRLAALEKIQAGYERAMTEQDLGSAFRANMAFHKTLFGGCGNRHLAELVDDFAKRTHSVRSIGMMTPNLLERARLEHHAILEALRSHDRKSLVRLCTGHIAPSKEAYLRLIA